MDDFKLGSPHDGWDMVVGKDQYGILLDGVVEDGLPAICIGNEVDVIKSRTIEVLGEVVTQYMVSLPKFFEFWFVDGDSIEICEV